MIRVRQVKIPIVEDSRENLLFKISKKLRISPSNILNYQIIKKSIDARDKNNIFFVYEVDVLLSSEENVLKKCHNKDIFKSINQVYSFPKVKNYDKKIVIVGSGPAGLFCAYFLAEVGLKPLIIEQGEKMEDRITSVDEFFKTNQLNPLSNIQFGEGGAGTFSDGKLNTMVKDKLGRGKRIFEIFVEAGAPKEIMYEQKPHIGTDVLRNVIVNIREKIISMGGEFRFSTKLTDIFIENNKIIEIEVNHHERISCDTLVLAIGHSARDTFYLLHDKKILMKNKNFAVGLRIEHPQEMINESQYGKYSSVLEPASYKLTHQCENGRGVYSFCMCPGGYVVNASSEEGRVVVNGMSNYKRDSRNANSAIVVTVSQKDFGDDLFGGLEFQRRLEEKAYEIGGGFIPIQLFDDYLNHKVSNDFLEVLPEVQGNYKFADLNLLFPLEINQSLKEGIISFDKKIKGFARKDAVLLGVESRTSSPIIIERNEEYISNIEGIYPCGEGAGYAGGITTAAIDGVKVAEAIAKR